MNSTQTTPNRKDMVGGAFADALTLTRLLLTPLIMGLILWRWPELQIAVLVSILFVIAAITDILDDLIGGSSRASARRYGYLDDVSDTVLIIGTLLALLIVVARHDILHWAFGVPVILLIGREVIVGLFKGYELSRFGWPDNPLSNAKVGFSLLGLSLLVASPWLTQVLDRLRAEPETAMLVYGSTSPLVWIVGQICLWVAAFFSVWSGALILNAQRDDEGVFHV